MKYNVETKLTRFDRPFAVWKVLISYLGKQQGVQGKPLFDSVKELISKVAEIIYAYNDNIR